MSIGKTLVILSTGSNATEQLGELVGAKLRGGEVIELVSDLGGGKTTFVRGLANGMGSRDHVASPTFTINRQYKTPKLTLEHFDFYRLEDPGLVKHELAEALSPKSVLVIEWPDSVKDVLPKQRLSIKIKQTADSQRQLQFNCPNSLSYLIEGLTNANSNN